MRRWTSFLLLFLLLTTACQTEEPATVGFLQGDFAFVPHESQIKVLNIADATAPKLITELTLPGEVVKVVANGRFLYIAHQTSAISWDSVEGPPDSGLQIVDVSDPAQPKLRGFFRSHSIPTDLMLQDNIAYLADWEQVLVVDISDVDNPTSSVQLPNGANGVAVAGTLLATSGGSCGFRTGFCAGELRLYDLVDPKRPLETAYLQTEGLPGMGMALIDNYALVTGKGMWVVDVRDTTQLAVNGRYDFNNGLIFPAKIVVQGSIAYTLQQDGLQLLDISQPTTPVLLGQYVTDNNLTAITVRDGLAYLAGWRGLEIIDVSDPTNPQRLGSYAFANPIPSAPQPTAVP